MRRRFRTLAAMAVVSFLAGAILTGIYLGREDPNVRRIQQLEEIIARLEAERRIAQVVVLEQSEDPAGALRTRFRWAELRSDGVPGPSREFEIEGDRAYFEALVLKFDRGLVEAGDALRGRSLYLFQRVFGERQQPIHGFSLDEPIPQAYRTGEPTSEFERNLWKKFWEYAKDPKAAEAAGVRVAQGEAVFTRLVPDVLYELSIEAAGGINIQPRPLPAVLRPPHR